MANHRVRPTRYELALVAGEHGSSSEKVAAHYGISIYKARRWIYKAGMARQYIPAEDMLLMVDLHYNHQWTAYKIYQAFKEEITILSREMVNNILHPRSLPYGAHKATVIYYERIKEKRRVYYESVDRT